MLYSSKYTDGVDTAHSEDNLVADTAHYIKFICANFRNQAQTG